MSNVTTSVGAVALGITPKRLDNLLARSCRGLLARGSRGKSREIPISVLETIAVTLLLRRDLGLTEARALRVAQELRDSGDGSVPIGALASVRFDLVRLRSVLETAVADAIEDSAIPRRGRPPRGGN